MKYSNGKQPQQPGGHFILRSRRIARTKKIPLAVVLDDGLGQGEKLGVAAPEILLAVIGTGTGRTLANGASAQRFHLAELAGPPARRAFNPVPNAGDEHLKRNFQRDRRIHFHSPFGQPGFQKHDLRETAGKSVEHPAAGLPG